MMLASARPLLRIAIMALAAALTVAALAGCDGQSSATQTTTSPASGADASVPSGASRPDALRCAPARASRGAQPDIDQPCRCSSPQRAPQPVCDSHQPAQASAGTRSRTCAARQRSGRHSARAPRCFASISDSCGSRFTPGSASRAGTGGMAIRSSRARSIASWLPSTEDSSSELGWSGSWPAGAGRGAAKPGLGSIVTYRNGGRDRRLAEGVPAPGERSSLGPAEPPAARRSRRSRRQFESCVQSCWGATLGGATLVARSALGITSDDKLVWAAGEHLSPAGIAQGWSRPARSELSSSTSIPSGWRAISTCTAAAARAPSPSCRARSASPDASSNPTQPRLLHDSCEVGSRPRRAIAREAGRAHRRIRRQTS